MGGAATWIDRRGEACLALGAGRVEGRSERRPSTSPARQAAARRLLTAAQLMTLNQFPTYSGRRFWYLR